MSAGLTAWWQNANSNLDYTAVYAAEWNYMRTSELKKQIEDGALSELVHLYADIDAQKERYLCAIDRFTELYGERDVYVLSVPGRSELLGNHTDHNRGMVLAGAIDRDIIAIAAKNDTGTVNLTSEGYPRDVV